MTSSRSRLRLADDLQDSRMAQAGGLGDRPERMAGRVCSPDRVPKVRLGLVAASPVPRDVGQGSLRHVDRLLSIS